MAYPEDYKKVDNPPAYGMSSKGIDAAIKKHNGKRIDELDISYMIRHLVDEKPYALEIMITIREMPPETSTRQIMKRAELSRAQATEAVDYLLDLQLIKENSIQRENNPPFNSPSFTPLGRQIIETMEQIVKKTHERKTVADDIKKVTLENVEEYFDRLLTLQNADGLGTRSINHLFCMDAANEKIDVNDTALLVKGLSHLKKLAIAKYESEGPSDFDMFMPSDRTGDARKLDASQVYEYNPEAAAKLLRESVESWKEKRDAIVLDDEARRILRPIMSKFIDPNYELNDQESDMLTNILTGMAQRDPAVAEKLRSGKGFKVRMPIADGMGGTRDWITTITYNDKHVQNDVAILPDGTKVEKVGEGRYRVTDPEPMTPLPDFKPESVLTITMQPDLAEKLGDILAKVDKNKDYRVTEEEGTRMAQIIGTQLVREGLLKAHDSSVFDKPMVVKFPYNGRLLSVEVNAGNMHYAGEEHTIRFDEKGPRILPASVKVSEGATIEKLTENELVIKGPTLAPAQDTETINGKLFNQLLESLISKGLSFDEAKDFMLAQADFKKTLDDFVAKGYSEKDFWQDVEKMYKDKKLKLASDLIKSGATIEPRLDIKITPAQPEGLKMSKDVLEASKGEKVNLEALDTVTGERTSLPFVKDDKGVIHPTPEAAKMMKGEDGEHRMVDDILLVASKDTPESKRNILQRMRQSKATKVEAVAELKKLAVMELLIKGYNVKQMTEELELDSGEIYKTITQLKEQAKLELSSYFTEILPLQVKVSMEQLNAIIKTSMEIANNTELPTKDRMQALSMAQETQLRILSLLTEDKNYLSAISNAIKNNEELKE